MSLKLFPLGDQAITIEFGNGINEETNKLVLARYHELQATPLPGMKEAVPAYNSLTIYYDLLQLSESTQTSTVFERIKSEVENWLRMPLNVTENIERLMRIPVVYDGADLAAVEEQTGLSTEEIITIHSSSHYRVYMLGFLPGFAYMGGLDTRLFTKRKSQPENIKAGDVAIAGMQTGIYPLDSPGGWSVIGRTALRIFQPLAASPTLLQPGDTIIFYPVSIEEFNSISEHADNRH
jgi:inhibitor of KinA